MRPHFHDVVEFLADVHTLTKLKVKLFTTNKKERPTFGTRPVSFASRSESFQIDNQKFSWNSKLHSLELYFC